MRQNKKSLRIIACLVIAILVLFNIYIPKVSAAESYFAAEGTTLEIDEIDPTDPDQRLVSVRMKAAREMTIHSLHGYFTPVNSEDEELQTFMSWMGYSSGINNICYSMTDGEFDWNTADCDDDVVGDEGLHVQSGDLLIYATYKVKPGVEIMKRNMPVNLDLAIIDDGAETGKRVENVSMDAYVRAGHTLTVSKYIMGDGNLDVADTVVGGMDIEVGIVPGADYELTYLEFNGEDVTDQVQDNVYKMTVGREAPTFYANFQRVYHVLEGNDGEHVKGSDETLSFKVDTDVTEFCNQGLLMIDGENLDMEINCAVEPDNQTIILPASFLNTLEFGEHSFVAWFSEPEAGHAKASFKIVEEEEILPVPNTGAFTVEDEGVEVADNYIVVAVSIGIVVLTGFMIIKVRR